MLKLLSFTAALSAVLASFVPKVALGLPPVGNNNNFSTVSQEPNSNNGTLVNPTNPSPTITDPNSNNGTVIVNPTNPSPTITDPNSNGTVIVNPTNPYVNSYPLETITPNSNPSVVIVKPSAPVIVNPSQPNVTSQPEHHQSNCGGVIFGSPIPSPVPVNPYTGRFCH
jgi:hypothetical protein